MKVTTADWATLKQKVSVTFSDWRTGMAHVCLSDEWLSPEMVLMLANSPSHYRTSLVERLVGERLLEDIQAAYVGGHTYELLLNGLCIGDADLSFQVYDSGAGALNDN